MPQKSLEMQFWTSKTKKCFWGACPQIPLEDWLVSLVLVFVRHTRNTGSTSRKLGVQFDRLFESKADLAECGAVGRIDFFARVHTCQSLYLYLSWYFVLSRLIWSNPHKARLQVTSLSAIPQNRKGTEGQLGSEPLMFLSSRMSPRACWPPSS